MLEYGSGNCYCFAALFYELARFVGYDAKLYSGRAYVAGTGFDTGIPMDEAVVEYVTDALGSKITAEQYGQPRGLLTIIQPVETDEEAEAEGAKTE